MAKRLIKPPSHVQPLPLVGAHISTAGGLGKVPERAKAYGAEVVQVFASNPRTWRAEAPDPVELGTLARALAQASLPLFLHAIYLVNLASPDAELRRRSALAIAHALVTGALAQGAGVVTHVGSHRGQGFAEAIPWIEMAIAMALTTASDDLARFESSVAERTLPPLLLETGAGSGATVGRSLEELETLVRPLDHLSSSPASPVVGLCLDTAHLFAAGYPIHRPSGLDSLVRELERRGLLGRVRLVHLNDAATAFASNRDRHANPGEGALGYEALKRMIGHPAFRDLPFVLEVPGSDGHGPRAAEISLVKSMREGAPYPPSGRSSSERGQVGPA